MTKKIIKTIICSFVALLLVLSYASSVNAGIFGDNTGSTHDVPEDQDLEAYDSDECTPLSAKLQKSRRCLFCPLFTVLYTAGSSVSTASFEKLATPFQTLLLIGFALYIAFLTLRQVGAFTKQDGSKYISEVLLVGFKALVVWLLLGNGVQIYRLGLEPIINAGLDVGASFLSGPTSGQTTDITSCGTGSVTGTDKTFYSDAFRQKLDCYLRKVAEETALGNVVGSAVVCSSEEDHIWNSSKYSKLISGLAVKLFAWLIYIAFAFYLIDAVIRLAIIGAILPFLIAAWPFKITSGYTKKGWSMFLNSFFIFVFLGLIVNVTVELLASSVTRGASNTTEIMDYIANDNIDALGDLLDAGTANFLFVILCGIFGFKLCKESASLAAEMGTSGGSNIASKIGGTGVNIAKTAGLGAAKVGVKGGAKVIKGAASVIPVGKGKSLRTAVNNRVDSIAKGIGNIKQKAYDALTPEGRQAKRNQRNQPVPNSANDDDLNTNTQNNNNDGGNGGGSGSGSSGGNTFPNNGGTGGNELPNTETGTPTGGNVLPQGADGAGGDGAPSVNNYEAVQAENATENRNPDTGSGSGKSQTDKHNIDEAARNAAAAEAAKLTSQGGQESAENSPACVVLKEGKVYDQQGQLQSETIRDSEGNLVQATYEGKRIAGIISEDKDGNREWKKFDAANQVIESGSSKMAMERGRSYVASENVIRGGTSTSRSFYSNGNIKTLMVQTVDKDGKVGELLRYREYNQDGKLVVNRSGKKSQKAGEQPTSTATPSQTQSAPQMPQPQQSTNATAEQKAQGEGQPVQQPQNASDQQQKAGGEQPQAQTQNAQQSSQTSGQFVPSYKANLEDVAKQIAAANTDGKGQLLQSATDDKGNALHIAYNQGGQISGITRIGQKDANTNVAEFISFDDKKNVTERTINTTNTSDKNRTIRTEQTIKDGISTTQSYYYDPKHGPDSPLHKRFLSSERIEITSQNADLIGALAKTKAGAGISENLHTIANAGMGSNVQISYNKDGKVTSALAFSRGKDGFSEREKVDFDKNGNIAQREITTTIRSDYHRNSSIVETSKDGVITQKYYHSTNPRDANPHLDAEITIKPGQNGNAEIKKYDANGKLISTETLKEYEAKLRASEHQKSMNDKDVQNLGKQGTSAQGQGGQQPENRTQPLQGQSDSKPQGGAQPNGQPQSQQPREQPKAKPVDRLKEGVLRDEKGNMRSETVKQDNGSATRVLYNSAGKIYNIAEEDGKGNREWYSFGSEDNPSAKPVEHGIRTINDDGSVSYALYDNNDKLISRTVENADGSTTQSFYNAAGDSYAKIERDKDGNITCSLEENKTTAQNTSQAPADSGSELKPEGGSSLKKKTIFDTSKKNKADANKGKDKKDDDDLNVRIKELETLVRDLNKTISGMGHNSESVLSLSGIALDTLKSELNRRGIKTIG